MKTYTTRMLAAGVKALLEAQSAGKDHEDIVAGIYRAMEAVEPPESTAARHVVAAMREVLAGPVPSMPRVGSYDDLLQDLSDVLPGVGELSTSENAR